MLRELIWWILWPRTVLIRLTQTFRKGECLAVAARLLGRRTEKDAADHQSKNRNKSQETSSEMMREEKKIRIKKTPRWPVVASVPCLSRILIASRMWVVICFLSNLATSQSLAQLRRLLRFLLSRPPIEGKEFLNWPRPDAIGRARGYACCRQSWLSAKGSVEVAPSRSAWRQTGWRGSDWRLRYARPDVLHSHNLPT